MVGKKLGELMGSIFRFFRNLLMLAIVAFAACRLWQNPEVRVAGLELADRFTTGISQLTGVPTARQLQPSPKQLKQADPETASSRKHYTWSRPQASVYVDLKHNQQLQQAAISGINAWNQTGVFTFKRVAQKKGAQVVISAIDDSATNAAGQTQTAYDPTSKRILKAHVELNRYYLQNAWYGYSKTRIVNTVEHELGHAIGLNHQRKVSVMYPVGSLYTIQPTDIRKVAKLYHEN
jgi:predicted Zn-dependent protease